MTGGHYLSFFEQHLRLKICINKIKEQQYWLMVFKSSNFVVFK